MAPRKIAIAPDLVAEGKRLYEQTTTPLRDVAAMMGICRRTLENRIREWNWTRRRTATRPIELHHALRGAVIAAITDKSASAGASLVPVTPQQRMAIVLRIQETVEDELAAVKRVLDKVAPAKPDETEQCARTLASISHTLRDLATIMQPEPETPPANETDNDNLPHDIDEFREELARRIRALIDAEQTGASEDSRDDAGAPDTA